jgi:hypothetical protein
MHLKIADGKRDVLYCTCLNNNVRRESNRDMHLKIADGKRERNGDIQVGKEVAPSLGRAAVRAKRAQTMHKYF